MYPRFRILCINSSFLVPLVATFAMSTDEEVRQLTPDLEKGTNSTVHHIEGERTLHKIRTSEDGNVVHMGPYAFHKDELRNAFGGSLNPGLAPPPPVRGYNAVPMGLATFAICAFIISLIHVQARSVTNQSILIGGCFFVGGVLELISGVLALVVDNTFAGTALSIFSGFWLSYGAILCPGFQIATQYETTVEYQNALGFFLMGWCIFSFFMWSFTFKSTWPFFSLFFLITVWIGVLAGGMFTQSTNTIKGGGVIGLLAAFNAFYLMWAGIASKENSYIVAHPLYMPYAPRVD